MAPLAQNFKKQRLSGAEAVQTNIDSDGGALLKFTRCRQMEYSPLPADLADAAGVKRNSLTVELNALHKLLRAAHVAELGNKGLCGVGCGV